MISSTSQKDRLEISIPERLFNSKLTSKNITEWQKCVERIYPVYDKKIQNIEAHWSRVVKLVSWIMVASLLLEQTH